MVKAPQSNKQKHCFIVENLFLVRFCILFVSNKNVNYSFIKSALNEFYDIFLYSSHDSLKKKLYVSYESKIFAYMYKI